MSEENKSQYTEVHEEPRPMSDEDVKDYRGLTLNENGEQDRSSYEEGNPGIHVQFVNLHDVPWWKKALWIIAAVLFLGLAAVAMWFFFLWGAVIFLAGGIVYLLKKYIF